jgi:hypothetical protein
MSNNSWIENLGGGTKGIITIERLEVTEDQIEVEKEDANVEEVTKD